jgi:hypothetical protein
MSKTLLLPKWLKNLAFFFDCEEGEKILADVKENLFVRFSNDQAILFKEQGKREFIAEIENAIKLLKKEQKK